jgi:hypothetical protein
MADKRELAIGVTEEFVYYGFKPPISLADLGTPPMLAAELDEEDSYSTIPVSSFERFGESTDLGYTTYGLVNQADLVAHGELLSRLYNYELDPTIREIAAMSVHSQREATPA